MKILSTIFFLAISLTISGQETSDAEAIAILDKVSEDYKKDDQHQIDFFLDIELPGEAKESQKGKLLHQDENFVLELGGRTIISNGSTLWLYLEEMNEVQVNDAEMPEEADLMSRPSDLFELHKSDMFIFALSSHIMEGGERITQIEGKPTDPDSDYSKVRISLSEKGQIKRFKVFSKDGSRFTMRLEKVDGDVSFDESTFSFNPEDYPGVHVEDLRF